MRQWVVWCRRAGTPRPPKASPAARAPSSPRRLQAASAQGHGGFGLELCSMATATRHQRWHNPNTPSYLVAQLHTLGASAWASDGQLTKPHTCGSHLEHGSLPQIHTKAPGCDSWRHSCGTTPGSRAARPRQHLVPTQPSTSCTLPPSPQVWRAGAAQAAPGAKRATEHMGNRCLHSHHPGHSPTCLTGAGLGTRAPQENTKPKGLRNKRQE